MMTGKLLFHLKLFLCLVVVAAGGRKRKNLLNFNICDIQKPEIIYCFCDVNYLDEAAEGNCWIFSDSSNDEDIWDGFASQTKIRRLTFHLRPDGVLKSIPQAALENLPSLEFFEVQYATIANVKSFTFMNSTILSRISLTRNSIESLSENAFAHLPSLSHLALGENFITEVNRRVFVDLPHIQELLLDHNNVSILHDRAFQDLTTLRKLELFSNQIQVITPDTFRGLVSLEHLDLHKNRLQVIGNNTFEELQALRTLDLQENSLKYIAPDGLLGLLRLRKLNLQNNKLHTIGHEVFQRTPSIQYLDLRANMLSTLAYDTVEPIMSNIKNHTMQLLLEGNSLRCDTRLTWMFKIHNLTRSYEVRRTLESLLCYFEIGSLPSRLEGQTVTPVYEISTLGIGPIIKLFDLHTFELPLPTALTQTPAPESEEEKEVEGSFNEIGRNKAQNDMAPVQDMVQSGSGSVGTHHFASVQDSEANGSDVSSCTTIMTTTFVFHVAVLCYQP